MKTVYSESDFKIEWHDVVKILSETYFFIGTDDGNHHIAIIKSIDEDKVQLISPLKDTSLYSLHQIVYLKQLQKGFWNRLYASIDLGFDLTKANNLKQLSIRSNIGYASEFWLLDAGFNSIYSEQDSIEPVRRNDGEISYKYYLPLDWYITLSITFLSNTEQKIKLRTNGNLGLGNYVVRNSRLNWGISGGATFNNEEYFDAADNRRTWESFFGTDLNIFGNEDLSFLTKVTAYTGITDWGRFRSDISFDTKYDIIYDFYVKVGFTVNYDNRPVQGASETDYVVHTGFGWEW